MLLWTVLQAESRRSWILLRRYPAQLISDLLISVVLVAVILASNQSAQQPERLISLLSLFLALSGLQSVHQYIKEHRDMGTLEQIYLSSLRLRGLVLVRLVTDFARAAVLLLVGGVALFTIFRLQLTIDWRLVPVSVLVYIAMSGLGLLLGAMTIRMPKVDRLVNILTLFFLGLVVIPPTLIPGPIQAALSWVMPFSQASKILSSILAGLPVSTGTWVYLVGLAVGYCGIGALAFVRSEEHARRDGQLAAT